MEKLKKYKYIILILLIVLGLSFYWYEWRPSRAYLYCDELVRKVIKQDDKVDNWTTVYDYGFKVCLRQKGIK